MGQITPFAYSPTMEQTISLFEKSQSMEQTISLIENLESVGNQIPILFEDLIEEILVRSLVRNLLQFRCVSKEWCSLISSKRFIKKHLQNSLEKTSFTDQALISIYMKVKYRGGYGTSFCVLDPLNELIDDKEEQFSVKDGYDEFVGCSNGLHCFIIDRREFILWNPCTRKSNKLPLVDPDVDPIDDYGIESFGFGYDELNDDYKVFTVIYFSEDDDPEAEFVVKLYSLRTNSWKTVEYFEDCWVFVNEGILVAGKLHWRSVDSVCTTKKIVSFDLSTEVGGIVEYPSVMDECLERVLVVIKGRLCLQGYCPNKCCVDVWILKDYGMKESWYKAVRVPFGEGPHNNPWSSTPMSIMRDPAIRTPMCITQDLEILCYNRSTFTFYNPQTKTHRQPRLGNVRRIAAVDVRLQSLVSPFHGHQGI